MAKVIQRGRAPARTYFSNISTGALIDGKHGYLFDGKVADPRTLDAGWGVAKEDGPQVMFLDSNNVWRVAPRKRAGA